MSACDAFELLTLCIRDIIVPFLCLRLNVTKKEICLGSLLWGFAQSSWLLPAYLLEFKGL